MTRKEAIDFLCNKYSNDDTEGYIDAADGEGDKYWDQFPTTNELDADFTLYRDAIDSDDIADDGLTFTLENSAYAQATAKTVEQGTAKALVSMIIGDILTRDEDDDDVPDSLLDIDEPDYDYEYDDLGD